MALPSSDQIRNAVHDVLMSQTATWHWFDQDLVNATMQKLGFSTRTALEGRFNPQVWDAIADVFTRDFVATGKVEEVKPHFYKRKEEGLKEAQQFRTVAEFKKKEERPLTYKETLEPTIEAGKMEKLEVGPRYVVEWLTTTGWKQHGIYKSKEKAEKVRKLLDEGHDIEARVREQ